MSYNNGPTIVRDGLVLYYDPASPKSYVSGSTTIYDLSPTGTTASLINGVGYASSSQGIFNFDGVNDYISLSRPSSIVTSGSLSVSMFAKWDTVGTSSATITTLMDNSHSAAPVQGFVLQNRPDLNQRLTFSARPDQNGATSSFVVGHNTWYHITGTHDGTVSRLYINGVLDGFVSQSGGVATVQPTIDIGRWQGSGGSRYFTGSVGQVLIYTRSLSLPEVQQNYNAAKGRYSGFYLNMRESFSPATQSWVLGPTYTISDRLYSATASNDSNESYFNLRAPMDTAWVYCIFNNGTGAGSGAPTEVVSLRDSSGTVIAAIGYKRLNGRTFHVMNGVAEITITVINTSPLENADWYVWLHCDRDRIRGWASRTNARPSEPVYVNQSFTGGELPRVRNQKITRFYTKPHNVQQCSWDNIIVRSEPSIGDAPF